MFFVLQELIDLHDAGLTHQNSITARTTPLKWIKSPGSHRSLRSSAEASKQALLDSAIKNPQTAQARQLIAAAYGVTSPPLVATRSGLQREMLAAAAAIHTGLCAQHGMLLSRCQCLMGLQYSITNFTRRLCVTSGPQLPWHLQHKHCRCNGSLILGG